MKTLIIALALSLPMLATITGANAGDRLLDELVRQGSIVHPGGMLAGR
ncbi:MAG: hypothetical protein AB1749_04130 [Pseudomonadota bacterium]